MPTCRSRSALHEEICDVSSDADPNFQKGLAMEPPDSDALLEDVLDECLEEHPELPGVHDTWVTEDGQRQVAAICIPVRFSFEFLCYQSFVAYHVMLYIQCCVNFFSEQCLFAFYNG